MEEIHSLVSRYLLEVHNMPKIPAHDEICFCHGSTRNVLGVRLVLGSEYSRINISIAEALDFHPNVNHLDRVRWQLREDPSHLFGGTLQLREDGGRDHEREPSAPDQLEKGPAFLGKLIIKAPAKNGCIGVNTKSLHSSSNRLIPYRTPGISPFASYHTPPMRATVDYPSTIQRLAV